MLITSVYDGIATGSLTQALEVAIVMAQIALIGIVLLIIKLMYQEYSS